MLFCVLKKAIIKGIKAQQQQQQQQQQQWLAQYSCTY
jgi:hypothetical protein